MWFTHTPLCSNKACQCKSALRPLQSAQLESALKDVIVRLGIIFSPDVHFSSAALVMHVVCVARGGAQLPQIAARGLVPSGEVG